MRTPISVGVALLFSRGADQRQVGERLWVVAECLAGEAEFFSVKAQVVRVAEHLLQVQARLVQLAGT